MPWCRTCLVESAARRQINAEEKESELRNKGIIVQVATKNILSEEAPEAYKDVDGVIENTAKADLARPIVRLEPLAVSKDNHMHVLASGCPPVGAEPVWTPSGSSTMTEEAYSQVLSNHQLGFVIP